MRLGCKYFCFFSIVSIIRGGSRWGRRCCHAGYASLSSVCTNYARRFSMPDETVETRPPWLDFSLPRRPCLGISVLCSIILQSLYSCAIRPPNSTACPHLLTPLTLRLNVPVLTCSSFGTALTTFMWEALILRCFPLDTLYSPEGMKCVLKKIMNCHEVPYSLIAKKSPAYPQSIRTWARG